MPVEVKIIDASKNKWIPDFRELVRYKDLFVTLTWRDFRVRYAQTTLGLLWAILQPVITLAILSLVFGKFIGVQTPVPHLLYTVAGMSLWSYFSYVLTNSGNSIIAHQDMVKKIYFPRIIIPVSKAIIGLVDFMVGLLIMIALFIYYGITPSGNVFFAPLFMLFTIVAALSAGIWLSALTVRFRDFQHVVPFLVQIGLYITPVAYPVDFALKNLPEWAQTIYFLNPMAGAIEGFRWSLFGGNPPGNMMYISIGMTLFLFVTGLIYFRKVEGEMADFI